MSNHDGIAEFEAIKARLDNQLSEPVLEDVDDDDTLPRGGLGAIVDYVTVEPLEPMRLMRDRAIGVGEDKQPYTLPVEVTYFSATRSGVKTLAAKGRNALLGWTPGTGNAGPMRTSGGFAGVVLDSTSKPSRYYRVQLWECVINMSPA